MDYTNNYQLKKPEQGYKEWDVPVNDNWDDIDGLIKARDDDLNITHVGKVLDPTDTDTAKTKHLSNAQAKVWQDHVGITSGNPHGTGMGDISGLQDALDDKMDMPVISIGDAGKLLAVMNDLSGVEWVNPPSSLPPIQVNDGGKKLAVKLDESGVEWVSSLDTLPVYGAGDAGKVLTVSIGGGSVDWKQPTGGGGVSLGLVIALS